MILTVCKAQDALKEACTSTLHSWASPCEPGGRPLERTEPRPIRRHRFAGRAEQRFPAHRLESTLSPCGGSDGLATCPPGYRASTKEELQMSALAGGPAAKTNLQVQPEAPACSKTSDRSRPQTYDLLRKNCNNFTAAPLVTTCCLLPIVRGLFELQIPEICAFSTGVIHSAPWHHDPSTEPQLRALVEPPAALMIPRSPG